MTSNTDAPPASPAGATDLEGLARQVDDAITAIESLEPAAREKAEALKTAIEAFHKAGLTTIVKTLKADPRGKELLFELVDDPTVQSLLALHGLIRTRPTEETPSTPAPSLELVQIQLPGAGPQWVAGPRVEEVTGEKPVTFAAGEASVIVIRSRAGLRAFRNACGHVGLPLDRGMCDEEAGTITCPWHGYRFDSDSGECLSAPQCQLEPFEVKVTDDVVWVRPS